MSTMLTVGDKFPEFNLKATVSIESVEKAFFPISNTTYKGKWLLVFFYPKDFTFVCPTEIKGFGDLNGQFKDRDCQVLAASTDSEFVHMACTARSSARARCSSGRKARPRTNIFARGLACSTSAPTRTAPRSRSTGASRPSRGCQIGRAHV